MATEITPEQRQALEATSGPLELFDGQTNEHYFLIQADLFRRLKTFLDLAEPSEAEKDADLKDWAKRSGYFDPAMDAYDSITPPQ